MSVAELHPEELFDKLVEGTLGESERERLVLHLQVCAVCRFDYAARLDFQQEALAAEQRSAPVLLARPLQRSTSMPTFRRRRPRILVYGIAAAVLISGSGALAAALGERPWQALAALFVSAPAPTATAAGARPVAKTASRAPALAPAPAPAASCPNRECEAAQGAAEVALGPHAHLPKQPAAPGLVAPAPSANARSAADDSGRSESSAARVELSAATAAKASAATPTARASAEEEATKPSGAAKLFAEANQARRAGQVGRATGLYHLLQEQYPGSSEAELSHVTLATLLLNGGDASGALSGFERYLAGSSHVLDAEALVGRARALERLGRRQLAIAAWREVQHRFPGSVYARQAAERLAAPVPP